MRKFIFCIILSLIFINYGINATEQPYEPELSHISIQYTNDDFNSLKEYQLKLLCFDQHQQLMPVDSSWQVDWSIEGIDGLIQDGKFIPLSTGDGIIRVNVFDLSATINIEIPSIITYLEIEPSIINVKPNEKKEFALQVFDQFNQPVSISDDDVVMCDLKYIDGDISVSRNKETLHFLSAPFSDITAESQGFIEVSFKRSDIIKKAAIYLNVDYSNQQNMITKF